MNTVKKSLLAIGLILGTLAVADPIADGILNGHKAGWYPSVNTPCPRICAAQMAKAEGEAFLIPSVANKTTYVCKAEATTAAVGSPGTELEFAL